MGDIWAVLLIAGLLVNPLVFFGSIFLVVFLNRRIRLFEPGYRGGWMVVLHLVLIAAIGLFVETVANSFAGRSVRNWFLLPIRAAPLLVVPGLLYVKLRRRRAAVPAPKRASEAAGADVVWEATPAPPAAAALPEGRYRTVAVRTAWAIALSGMAMPWLVGLGVKVYLMHMGHPTWPISSFLEPVMIPVLLGSTASLWSSPFLVLALLARYRILAGDVTRMAFRDRLWIVGLTHLGGMGSAVLLFTGVFWEFDILYLFAPMGLFLLPPMLLAYGAGLLAVKFRRRTPDRSRDTSFDRRTAAAEQPGFRDEE
ncbi:MAG: hypothetical protein JSV26_01615 [bacterium]|nr:MAG: hypothetical protein JSV26_01615 [bacterium]